jgi:acetylglutamate kinase
MIPKIETCLEAIDQGVDAAVILDGRVPHALLLEVFTDEGIGTMVEPDDAAPAGRGGIGATADGAVNGEVAR